MKLLAILFTASLLLMSCGGNKSKQEQKLQEALEEVTEGAGEVDPEKAKNCEEFVDQYEKWMDDYLVFLEKYMKNPMDAALSQEYSKVALEAVDWMEQWTSKMMYCASQEKYQKRFEEISEKAEKKMEELGLE